MSPLVRLVGRRDTDTRAIQALAELHLSFDHGIKRLEAVMARDDDLTTEAAPLLLLHRRHQAQLDEMGDIFEAMATTQKPWSQWLNETIDTAATPDAGLAENPREALRSSESRILSSLDACIAHILTDPVRGVLEHMKADTLDAVRSADLER